MAGKGILTGTHDGGDVHTRRRHEEAAVRRGGIAALVAACGLAIAAPVTLGASASAAADLPPGPEYAASGSTGSGTLRAAPADASRDEVLGLIVRTSSAAVSKRSLGATVSAAGADVAGARALTPTLGVIDFAQPMTFAEAAPIAAAVESRPDVIAVGPNRRVYPLSTPTIPNDPLFGQQWDMWDGTGVDDFGTRAAQLWTTTTGSSDVVVGVIDTGLTDHPDLVGTTVPGFDFISDASAARDGNQWDADPSDEGDWCPSDNTPSSWHGTHVHGTVNAVQDNGIGISGLAPSVKVQHLRVLGECGGEEADILAAVIWGSGGDLGAWFNSYPGADPGVNPTPASVLNMSLGGSGDCDAISQQVFDEARARGATLVVAAGNEAASVSTSWPANCARVITVASSTRSGTLSSFSNFGTSPGQISLAAPGSAILSTINRGTTYPTTPNYGLLSGTSMAAPHVAASAAILYSLGVTRPDDVLAELRKAVRAFPAGSGCDTTRCGAGLLDASALAAVAPVTVPGAPTGVAAVATSTTRATLRWTAPGADGGSPVLAYRVEESVEGGPWNVLGDTDDARTTSDILDLTPGVTYAFRVAAINAVGAGASSVPSAPITMPTQVVTTPGPVRDFTRGSFTKTSRTYRVTVRWKAPLDDGGSAVTGYVARLGRGTTWSSWTTLTRPATLLTNLRRDTNYRLQVRAVNSEGRGTVAVYVFRTPLR